MGEKIGIAIAGLAGIFGLYWLYTQFSTAKTVANAGVPQTSSVPAAGQPITATLSYQASSPSSVIPAISATLQSLGSIFSPTAGNPTVALAGTGGAEPSFSAFLGQQSVYGTPGSNLPNPATSSPSLVTSQTATDLTSLPLGMNAPTYTNDPNALAVYS